MFSSLLYHSPLIPNKQVIPPSEDEYSWDTSIFCLPIGILRVTAQKDTIWLFTVLKTSNLRLFLSWLLNWMLHLWMLLLPLMRSSHESSLTSSELIQATNFVRFLDYICFYIVIINVRHQEVHTYAWIVGNKIYTVSYGCGNQSVKLVGWVVLWLPYPASTTSCPIRNKNGTETAQTMNIHVVKE
jgi:hypothetical protein